jgi:outer membrane protein TolC
MPKISTNLSILFLLALSAVFAQESAPVKLTLKDAVNLALKQNPQVILANLGVSQSEQDRLLARAALLPQVGARASETVNRLNLAASIGMSFPGFAQHVGPFYVVQAGVGVTAPVFDLTLWRRYRSSRLGVDSVRAQEVGVREESVLLVVSQYLGSQRAAADVQAAQSRVDLAQALYDQAADLQKNGVGTGIDTLRSNVQLQNEKQRSIVARTQLENRTRRPGELLRHPGGFGRPDPRSRLCLASRIARRPHPRTTRHG